MPVPPPSPIHRRSPIQSTVTQDDDDDTVAQTTDSTMIIRVTPRKHGEEILSVEVAEEEDGKAQQTGREEEKKE